MSCRSLQTGLVRDGTWQNIIITWRNSDGRLALFTNGANRQLQTGAGQYKTIQPGGKMYLGQLHSSFASDKTIKGSVADLEIWSNAVADSTVPKIYNFACQSGNKFQPGQIISWKKILEGTYGGGQATKVCPSTCTKPA